MNYNIAFSIEGIAGMTLALFAVVIGVYKAESLAGGKRWVTAVVAVVLAIWQATVMALAIRGFFVLVPGETIPRIALMVVPLAGTSLLVALSPAVRAVVDRIPVHRMIEVQVYRVLGGAFVVGYLLGIMPPQFALPAGLGDIAVGLSAPFVATELRRRFAEGPIVASIWNALGVIDLIVAISMGILTSPGKLHLLAMNQPNLAITQFPFVLVPMVLVPLSLLLHGLTAHALARRKISDTEDAAPAGANTRATNLPGQPA